MKKCICWLLLFLCLCIGQTAMALNLLFVGEVQSGRYFIDTDTIQQDGDIKYLWTLFVDKNDGSGWIRHEAYARNQDWFVVHYAHVDRNGQLLHGFTAQSASDLRIERVNPQALNQLVYNYLWGSSPVSSSYGGGGYVPGNYIPPSNTDVFVNGYYRKDGTYVQPHMRSRADNSTNNNFSHRGNINPYTGKKGYQR